MEAQSCLIVLRSGGAHKRYCSSFRGGSTKCILSWKFDNVQPFFHFVPNQEHYSPVEALQSALQGSFWGIMISIIRTFSEHYPLDPSAVIVSCYPTLPMIAIIISFVLILFFSTYNGDSRRVLYENLFESSFFHRFFFLLVHVFSSPFRLFLHRPHHLHVHCAIKSPSKCHFSSSYLLPYQECN